MNAAIRQPQTAPRPAKFGARRATRAAQLNRG
jgi:hypothetical protein